MRFKQLRDIVMYLVGLFLLLTIWELMKGLSLIQALYEALLIMPVWIVLGFLFWVPVFLFQWRKNRKHNGGSHM